MNGGIIGSADKGCSYEEIVEFNIRNFGTRGDCSDFDIDDDIRGTLPDIGTDEK